MQPYRRLARNHDFTALWVGQVVSEVGTRVSLFVLPLITWAATGSTLLAAAVEATHLLGLAVTLLPAGLLADRVDRLRLMRWASGSGALLYTSLTVAAAADALTVPHLLVVAALTGVGTGCFMPAETSAVRDVVEPDLLPAALAQNQARQHVASLTGGPLGGALLAIGRWAPFAANAAAAVVSWLLLGRIRADLSASPTPARPLREQLAEGWRFVATHPVIRTALATSVLLNLVVNALFFAAVLRLVQAGHPPWQVGLVETASGIGGILGAVVAPWLVDRLPTGRLTIWVAWGFTPLVVPMALWNHPAVVATALGLALLPLPAANAAMAAYRITVTPPELVGRVQSTVQFAAMSTLPLAPVLGGLLLTHVGGSGAMLGLGAVAMAVALVPTLSRSVRSLPRPAVWQADALRTAQARA